MTCPSTTGVELVIAGRSYTVHPAAIGLPADIVEQLEEMEPEQARRLIEALLYGVVVQGPLVFRSLDGGKTRLTVHADGTAEIGDLT